jgi:hypothetical protein
MKIGNNMLTGVVTRVAFEDEPVYDVRTNEGATYRGVKLRGAGASVFPVSVGQNVHMIRPRGAYDLPFITGADVLNVAEQTPDASSSETYAPDSRDLQLRHADNTLSLSTSGVTVDAITARVQLPASGRLRVERDGVSSHSVLRGQQFTDALFSYIAELETTLEAVQKQVALLSSAQGLSGTPTAIAANVPPSSSSVAKATAENAITDAITIP